MYLRAGFLFYFTLTSKENITRHVFLVITGEAVAVNSLFLPHQVNYIHLILSIAPN